MRVLWVLTIVIFLPAITVGQNVSITGNALFYASEKIEVFQFKNRVTNQKEFITNKVIQENGSYQLSFDIDQPKLIGIKIEMREIFIHIHPNSIIQLDFLPIENSDNQRVPIRYRLSYRRPSSQIAPDSAYQNLRNDFAQLQLDISTKSNIKNLYDSFFIAESPKYKAYQNNDELFNTYYTYFKANAYLQTKVSKTKLIEEYILNKNVAYHSREYLRFFSAIFNPRINQLFIKNSKEFNIAIAEFKIYTSLLNVLAIDSTMKDEEVRSLALLNYVKSSSSNNLLSKELKSAIIGQMANFCQYPVQKEAARFYQGKKKTLQKNTEAPIFELEDQYGQKLSLQSFRGKPMYLGFINSKSRTCNQDLQVIANLRKKYKKMEFLLVLTDRDSSDLSKLPDEASNLNYVYLNKEYTILETYEIWNYPVYFLLDKHGYFIESPAKRPEEMYSVFEKMFAKKPRGKRYEIIKD